jgi:hypothetical protein
LEAILEDLADLDDLDDSVTAVESDPLRYGLSVEEVRRRRGFVEQVKDQIEDLRDSTTKAYNFQVSFRILPSVLNNRYSLQSQRIHRVTPPITDIIKMKMMMSLKNFVNRPSCKIRMNN